jgi:magnesium transporter
MARKSKKRLSRSSGLAPGELVYTGNLEGEDVVLTFTSYNEMGISSETGKDLSKLLSKFDNDKINWLNIDGIHFLPVIESIGQFFKIHPLVMEDIVNIEQLPKADEYEQYLFFSMKIMQYRQEEKILHQEQVSFILGKNYMVSFQDRKGDLFDPIRKRIEAAPGRMKKRKADYLFYLLIDNVVDAYYHVIECVEEQLEVIEENILHQADQNLTQEIVAFRKQLLHIRKNLLPLNEAVNRLMKTDPDLVQDTTYSYLHDLSDHVKHQIQLIEGYRESITNLMELNMANLSNRMNNVVKTLTIITSIFIPLTFVAGVYGMNFKYMPEIGQKWGYPVVMAFMIVVGLGMFLYMKLKKWF